MPAVVNQIANELLPLIFRRRPLTLRQPIGNDLPEQGGITGNLPRPNILSAQEPAPPITVPPGMQASQVARADEVRPRTTTPAITAPASPRVTPPLESDPVVSRSGQVMDEYSTRPARRVETDTRGRPSRNIALEGDEQTLDYANRVAKYEPQEGGGGWWPSIRAALAGFAVGGPVGAGTAFGVRKLREKFEPKLADQEWKRQQMGEVAPAVESIRQNRKDTLQEESTRASTELAKARTKALTDPKTGAKWVIKQDENGVFRPVNQATGLDPDGKPVKGRLASPSEWELKVDDRGRYVPVNKRTGLDQNGRPVTARSAAGKAEEDVAFGNQQIQSSIAEAEAEKDKIKAALYSPDGKELIPRTVEATDILTGTERTMPNPDYTYNMTRLRQLDDQIRRWRTQLKAPKKRAVTATAEDPDIRAYADQYFNGDYAAAEAAAKKP